MSNTNNLVEDALNGHNALPLDHEIRIFLVYLVAGIAIKPSTIPLILNIDVS